MDRPPPIPQPKSLRFAATLNLILPGTGQIYLGQRVLGCILALAFLGCFVAMIVIFFIGYGEYLSVALHPLEGRQLEQLTDVFHKWWELGLLVASIGIYLGSLLGLRSAALAR